MVGPGRGGGGGKMVAAQLMLVNHFFISLTHNSPDAASFPDINSVVVDVGCSHGCTRCSPINGCLSCKPPFFLVLHREGTRQTASCSRSCPRGFYKLKKRRNGFCSKCTMRGCEACAVPRYCSACHHHYLNFFGTCIRQSPDNELEELRILEKQPQYLYPGMLATSINSSRSDSSSSHTSSIYIRNNSSSLGYNDIISAKTSTLDGSIGKSESNFSVITTDSQKPNLWPSKVYSPATAIRPTPSLSSQPPHSTTVSTTASPQPPHSTTVSTKASTQPPHSTTVSTTASPQPPHSTTASPQPPHSTTVSTTASTQPPHSTSVSTAASTQPLHSTTASTTATPFHTGRVKVFRHPCRSYWRRRSGKHRRRGHKTRRKDQRWRRNRGRRLRRKHRRDETTREDRYLRKLCRRKMRRRRRRRRRKENSQTRAGDLWHELPRVSINSERMARNPDSESHQKSKMGSIDAHFTEVPEMIDLSLLGEGGNISQDLPRNSSKHSRLDSVHRKFIYKNRPRAMAVFKQSKQYRRAKDPHARKIRHKTQKHKRSGRGA